MKFSPTQGQFYPDDFGYQPEDIPDDVIDVPQAAFEAALDRRPGELLTVEEGRIVILPAPEVDLVERAVVLERFWRTQQLAQTDALVTRHRDELEDGTQTTLSAEQYVELQAFRRALRDWPESGEFPVSEHRPVAPPWAIEQAA